MVTSISPYDNSYGIEHPGGDIVLERIVETPLPSKDDITHTVLDGENIFDISNRYYGDPGYWGIICDINNIYDPTSEVIPGMQLTISNGRS